MIIENAILHIVDAEQNSLICTEQELNLAQADIYDYLAKVTQRLLQTDMKSGYLPEESVVTQILQYPDFDFVARSIELVNRLFDLTKAEEDIPCGDYIVEQFEDEGKHYVALFKLQHKAGFTHFLQYEDGCVVNQLLLNRNLLPAPTVRLTEAVVIEIETLQYRLLEKERRIAGEKKAYLSELFLQVQSPRQSINESLKEVKKAIKEIAKETGAEEYQISADLQQAVYDSVDETQSFDVNDIGEKMFAGRPEQKEKFAALSAEKDWDTQPVANTDQWLHKYRKQKFKLDNGIEITIPMEVYQDSSAVEFVNQPDGSLSVIIKNIDEIKNKF